MPSWVNDRFQEILDAEKNGEGAECIEGLLAECKRIEHEGLHWEAKEIHFGKDPDWEKKANNDLGKTVSAFANSDGGLIFWGFNDDLESKPVPKVKEFEKWLQRRAPAATLPNVDVQTIGVEIKGENKGYAITLVPKSDIGPHQAFCGVDTGKYFRREANSCCYIRHHELDYMFGRRPHPIVLPEFVLYARPESPYILRVYLHNLGTGIARWSCVELRMPVEPNWVSTNLGKRICVDKYAVQEEGWSQMYCSRCLSEGDSIIYPGTHILHVELSVQEKPPARLKFQAFMIKWRTFAEGMRGDNTGEFEFHEDYLDKANKHDAIVLRSCSKRPNYEHVEDWQIPVTSVT